MKFYQVYTFSPNLFGPAFRRHARHFYILLVNRLQWWGQKILDSWLSTYNRSVPPQEIELESYFTTLPKVNTDTLVQQIAGTTRHFFAHQFDLLGSGWVTVKHGMACRGMEGECYGPEPEIAADADGKWLANRLPKTNLSYARYVWQTLFEQDLDGQAGSYTPIDWQIDFKSGYRWSEKTWFKRISFGRHPGVDVKVPWELARCQHLVQFALAYMLAKNGRQGNCGICFKAPESYQSEFRRQILDFIATNPPRFGVNWNCTMDVAIRAANWLVALDLFKAGGAEFDPQFLSIFGRSLYDHGKHIFNNLEWYPEFRGNHYLANIAGLVYISAYLKGNRETETWLAFAVQELVKEGEYQFNPDGSNFEGSTSYHRLSTEMMVYSMALVLGLGRKKRQALKKYKKARRFRLPRLDSPPLAFFKGPAGETWESPIPLWLFERMEKAAQFTMDITKPGGEIVQIGDNDSGRFLKIQPVFKAMTVQDALARYKNLNNFTEVEQDAIYWHEDHLDHRHLVAAINGLIPQSSLGDVSWKNRIETEMIRAVVSKGKLRRSSPAFRAVPNREQRIGTQADWDQFHGRLSAWPGISNRRYDFKTNNTGLPKALSCVRYPDFGLFIFRSGLTHIVIRCGAVGYYGLGCHSHNDQLSMEVVIDQQELVTDPGTFVYTALPSRRNAYRSVEAHFAPAVENREPASLDHNLFLLDGAVAGKCLYFGPRGFIGMHEGYSEPVYRVVEIHDRGVTVQDYSKNALATYNNGSVNGARPTVCFSPGYGIYEIR